MVAVGNSGIVGVYTRSFINKLVKLKQAHDRERMQAEAVSFINGQNPYNVGFVSYIECLHGYIAKFALLYLEIEKVQDSRQLLSAGCSFLKTDKDSLLYYV